MVSAKIPDLNDGTGNAVLARVLQSWGITLYSGVNGGGVIHFAKYLQELDSLNGLAGQNPKLFSIKEDTASFIPIGYYWASGEMAASLFTTGGAAHYGLTGLLGAKTHNVPMVAVVALSASDAYGKSPLQYTGQQGSNTVNIYKGLLGEGCVVIDKIGGLETKLIQVRNALLESKPTAILFHPDILSKKVEREFEVSWSERPKDANKDDITRFLSDFPEEINGKRIIIYVGEEAARYEGIEDLITKFSTRLRAPTLYSMNSVNAVSPNNPFAAGYIHLGFNDFSMELWKSLTKEDTVICIGYDPGEYEMNSANIPANVWHFTNEINPYSSQNGHFAHRVDGKYRQVRGDLRLILQSVLEGLTDKRLNNVATDIPQNLNTNENYGHVAADTVDLVEFYKRFPTLVKPGTIIVNDVSQAYKDWQRVTQRPLDGIKVYSSHRDSFMSGAFGVAIGAKFGQPNKEVELFTGDGCFEYFEGALARIRQLGIGVWIIDNGNFHIVDKGLDVVYGGSLPTERHHSDVPRKYYAPIAKAHSLDGHSLLPDLSNLEQIMYQKYVNSNYKVPISTLVSIPVDGNRVIGQNARLLNLSTQGQPNL